MSKLVRLEDLEPKKRKQDLDDLKKALEELRKTNNMLGVSSMVMSKNIKQFALTLNEQLEQEQKKAQQIKVASQFPHLLKKINRPKISPISSLYIS